MRDEAEMANRETSEEKHHHHGGRFSEGLSDKEKKETPFGPPLNIRYSPEELKEIVPMAPLSTIQVGEHFYLQMFGNVEKQGSQ
jgi:hypothetical protein